jgi:hypothetical protein
MGIDRDLADFLLCGKEGGVDFGRVATLGRLNLFDINSLREVFGKHGVPVNDDDIKKMRAHGYAEEFLRHLGVRDVASIDASTYEHATVIHDMNLPIGEELKRRFSVVIDGGTLEHIFNFPVAIRNSMEMLEIGGHFFSQTMANNFMGHGFYQFSPDLFYRVFSPENGFKIHSVLLYEARAGRPRWFEAADPQKIGERVELVNARPTYMLVHAERVAEVPLFSAPPQQADYSAMWKNMQAQHAKPIGIHGRLHRWTKPYNELFRHLMPAPVYNFLLNSIVRGSPPRGFRRRQFAPLQILRS